MMANNECSNCIHHSGIDARLGLVEKTVELLATKYEELIKWQRNTFYAIILMGGTTLVGIIVNHIGLGRL